MDESLLPNIFIVYDDDDSPSPRHQFSLPAPKSTSGSIVLRTPSPYHTPNAVRQRRRRENILAQFAEAEKLGLVGPSTPETPAEDQSHHSTSNSQSTTQRDITPKRSPKSRNKARNLLFSESGSESSKSEGNLGQSEDGLVCSFDALGSVDEVLLPDDSLTFSQTEAKKQLEKLDWKETKNKVPNQNFSQFKRFF
jgi:hypothetical protein